MTDFHLAAIPAGLSWRHTPVAWNMDNVDTEEQLTIQAGAATDWFSDPAGAPRKDDAPSALFVSTEREFTLSARVQVAFASTFDAGALLACMSDDVWAKLCFEYSPQRQPMVVSVVTRGVSDDCNSAPLAGESVFLRITRREAILAFHYSLDGLVWRLVRYFSLGDAPRMSLGFSAQSPTGSGCVAAFSRIHYSPDAVTDLRSGE
jgi:regulation of enolase protein 1 (concanavalin A-like superfamily)